MIDHTEAIRQSRSTWVGAVNAGDIDDYLDLLTEDVVWFPPGQSAVSGKDAFAAWVRPFMEAYEYEFEISEPHVTIADAWAIERGTFHSIMTSRSDERSGRHSGRYLVIWRRTSDAEWRIERYIDEAQLPGPAVGHATAKST